MIEDDTSLIEFGATAKNDFDRMIPSITPFGILRCGSVVKINERVLNEGDHSFSGVAKLKFDSGEFLDSSIPIT